MGLYDKFDPFAGVDIDVDELHREAKAMDAAIAARPEPVAPQPASSTFRRIAGDTAITALKGAIGLPEAAVGIADIATGGRTGKALETIGYRPAEAKEILSDFYTPEQKAAFGRVSQADGFVPTLQALAEDPSVAAHSVVESLPSMLGGAGVARSALKVAPKLAPWVAGAAGEGVISAGQAAESIRQESADGLLTPKQAGLSVLAGGGVGLTSGVAGKLATKLGIADIDTMLASGNRSAINKSILRQIGESALSEGVLEEMPQSAWEQVLQNVALDRPWYEGVGSASAQGFVAGGLMGAAGGGFNALGSRPSSETVSATHQKLPVPPATSQASGLPAGGVTPPGGAIDNPSITPPIAGARDMGDIPEFGGPMVAREAAPAAPVSNGPIGMALAAGGITSATMYQDFAANPFAEAPVVQPGGPAIAGQQVSDLLNAAKAPTELEQATRWADAVIAQGGGAATAVMNLRAADRTGRALVSEWKRRTKPQAIAGVTSAPGGVARDSQPGKTTQVDQAAHTAATSPTNSLPEPTTAQIEAGNYKKGHLKLHGLDISVENPAGSIRKGVDETGKKWQTTLAHHYGYIKGTVGRDKDHIDIFVGPQSESGKLYVVDQLNTKTGKFDEHKVMAGFASAAEAQTGYLANYDQTGPQRIGNITETTPEQFKQWLNSGNTKQAFASQASSTKTVASQKQRNLNDKRRSVKPDQDDLIVAMAKLGGLNREQATAQWGSTLNDMVRDLNLHATKNGKAGFLHAIAKTGRNLDEMRELLEEYGYLQPGSSIEDMYAKIEAATRGQQSYSNQREYREDEAYPFDMDGINFPSSAANPKRTSQALRNVRRDVRQNLPEEAGQGEGVDGEQKPALRDTVKHRAFLQRMLAQARTPKAKKQIKRALERLDAKAQQLNTQPDAGMYRDLAGFKTQPDSIPVGTAATADSEALAAEIESAVLTPSGTFAMRKTSGRDAPQFAGAAAYPGSPEALQINEEVLVDADQLQEISDHFDAGQVRRLTSRDFFKSGTDHGNPSYGHRFKYSNNKPVRGITSFAINADDDIIDAKVEAANGNGVLYAVRPQDVGGKFVVVRKSDNTLFVYAANKVDTAAATVISSGAELQARAEALTKEKEELAHEIAESYSDEEIFAELAALGVEVAQEQAIGKAPAVNNQKVVDSDQEYIDAVSKRFEEKFEDAIFEIDEDQQKKNLREGSYVIDRIPQEAERAALKGKLGAAARIAGRSSGADIADAGQGKTPGAAAHQVKVNQAQALTAWAKEHDLLIDSAEFSRLWAAERIQGAEHDVYFTKDDRVIKRLSPSFTTWMDYFNRVALHNWLFPDTAYDLKGFMLDNGKLFAVVEQPFIKQHDSDPVTDADIFKDTDGMGFTRKPSKGMSGDEARAQDFYRNDGVVMTDLHDANVFRAYDGTLAYIDAIIWMDYASKYQRLAERYGIDSNPDVEVDVDIKTDGRVKTKQDISIASLKEYDGLHGRIISGELSPAELQAAFASFNANLQAIKDELAGFKKDDILSRMGSWSAYRYKNEKKDVVVRAALEQLQQSFMLDKTLSYMMGAPDARQQAIQKAVDSITAEDIAAYAEEVAQHRQDIADRRAQITKAIENPETLEEFTTYLKTGRKVEDLPADKRQLYDELVAADNRDKQAQAQLAKNTVTGVDTGATTFNMVEGKHSKTGETLYVVQLDGPRLDDAGFKQLAHKARQLGGNYVNARQATAWKTTPGFQFKSQAQAEQFMALQQGDVVKEDASADKQNSAATKLREVATKLKEKAEEELSRERLSNTARRAAMANSAEESARRDIALAETMLNLADAIERGDATHLNGISAKTHVEQLQTLLNQAKWRTIRNNPAESMSSDSNRPARMEDIDRAEYPYPAIWGNHLRDVYRSLEGVKGAVKLRAWLSKATRNFADELITFNTADAIDNLRSINAILQKKGKKWEFEKIKSELMEYDRTQRIGIPDLPTLRAALREFLQYRADKREADRAKQLERSLVGQKVGQDFFPTPPAVAEQMVELAGVVPGMKVLEPSAGNGNIATALKDAGAEVEVAELSSSLREVLEAKGFAVVAHDFTELTEGAYDAIVMNPPFSNNQDIEHVRHAYTLLKPGGKLVAIVGEGAFSRSGKTEEAFRDWLDDQDAEIEKLPDGTFTDRKLLNTTGANARMVVLEKPAEKSAAAPAAVTEQQQPQPMATAEKITDFGEKLGGARKDFAAKFADAKDLDIATEPFSKTWPEPDYQKMLQQGFKPEDVAMVRAMRDEIPDKPRKSYRVAAWSGLVADLRGHAEKLLDGDGEHVRSVLERDRDSNLAADHILGRAELYLEVGHDVSLKGVTFRREHWALYNGEKNVWKWHISQPQKATAFSNMPKMLGEGDTKEQALAAFKQNIEKLTPQKKSATQFVTYSYRSKDKPGYYIGKKSGRDYVDLKHFDTTDEAHTYLKNNHAELQAQWDAMKSAPYERRDSNLPRIGENIRDGRDATPEMFQAAFGFRGVEFGNWVNNNERQDNLNDAFDALHDLAAIIGVPTKALSLNGELGLAFGARGTGGKQAPSAHYESGKVVINLTKKHGAGSLAHEWFHAFDSYLSRQRGGKSEYITDKPYKRHNDGTRQELLDAIKAVVVALNKTNLQMRSRELDKTRSKDYWSTGVEMHARAFENYVIDKLAAGGKSNDYLANIKNISEYADAMLEGFAAGKTADDLYPYLLDSEIAGVRDAFDNLFATLRTKETDKGIALFHRLRREPGYQMDATAVGSVIDRVTAGWRQSDREAVVLLDQFENLPTAVLEEAEKAGYDNADPNDRIYGVAYQGKIYLLHENLFSDYDVEEALLHERLHLAVRSGGKQKLVATLNSVLHDMGGGKGLLELAEKAGFDFGPYREQAAHLKRDERAAFYVEEFLAHVEGRRAYELLPQKALRAIRELWGAFRQWLQDNGFTRLARLVGMNLERYTQADLAHLLRGIRSVAIDGQGTDAVRFMTAWHGSPHDHNKFDSSKIGSGEGAQVYGYGLYFAGAREVAEWYQQKFSGSVMVMPDGKELRRGDKVKELYPSASEVWKEVVQTVVDNGSSEDALRHRVRMQYESMRYGATGKRLLRARELMKTLVLLQNSSVKFKKDEARLYQVELAPAEDEYLLWDKPLSEQSEKVKDAFRTARKKDRTLSAAVSNWRNKTGQSVYRFLSAHNSGDKAASVYLHSLGIRGIKYLDGNSRNRPIKDIKKAFLSALPEDAKFDDVLELVETGKFSPEQEALLKALEADDWLGFDYPSQAISAALGNDLAGFDPSKALSDTVAELAKDQQFNYVIFNDEDVTITDKYSLASTPPSGLKAVDLQREFAGLPFASRIKVVQSSSDLPGGGPNSLLLRVEGQYKDGVIYLVADNLPSAERAKVVALGHELTHAGQSAKLLDMAVQWFRSAQAKGDNGSAFQKAAMIILRQEALKRGYNIIKPDDFRQAVQEATAVIAETAYRTGETNGLLRRLLMHLKHFLRNAMGMKQLPFTDTELVAVVVEMMAQGQRNMTNGTGPDGGKFALQGVVATFNDALESLRDDSITQHYIFNLGRPSQILSLTGIPDLPIKMRQDVVKKVTGLNGKGKHNLPIELLYNLPRHINNPVAIFASDTQADSKTLLLQFRHNSKPVMASLQLEVRQGNLEVNSIVSVYERNEVEYANWVHRGRLESLDKLKGQWLLKRLRAAIAPEMSGSLTPNKILYHVSEPVKSGVREDIDGKNVQFSLGSPADKARDRQLAEHLKQQKLGNKISTMVRDLADLAESMIPPKLKANMGKILSNPWFGSEGSVVRRAIVNLNLKRSHTRNELIHKLMKADPTVNYPGTEGLDNILKDATKAEVKAWNQLIKKGNVQEVQYTEKELKQKGYSSKVIAAYQAFHSIIAEANRMRFEKLNEIALLPYQNESWFDELKGLLDYREQLNVGLDEKGIKALTTLLKSMKKLGKSELNSENNPTNKPVDTKVADAYLKFIDRLNSTSEPGLVRMAYRHITEYHGEIDAIRNEWGQVKGYAPNMRNDGDWHVSVYQLGEDENGNPIRSKVFMQPTITEFGAKKLKDRINADMKGHLKGVFNQYAEYQVKYARNTATPGELLAYKGNELALEALVNNAFEKAGIFKTKDVDVAAMKRSVMEELTKEIMAQGFSRHGISRQKHQIEGYRDEDYQAVLKEFISGMSGWLAKMQYAVEVTREADTFSQSNPDDKVWIHSYYKDSMKNSTYLDEVSATARSVGAVWYLGFKVSSAVINGFQNYTVGQAELARLMKQSGKKGEPVLLLAKAQRDVLGKKINDEELQVLDKAIRQGTLHAQAIRSMSGLNEQGFGSNWKKFAEAAMTPFSWVEQHLNREPAMLAAYRVFKSTPANQFDQAAFDRAEEFVNSTHYVMGSENLPELVRMLGPIGKTAYLFQGYVHNYLLWLSKRARNGEFEAIARSFGAIAMLGGVFALPGGDDLDKWIEKWFGVSYKMQFKQFVKENVGSYGTPGELLEGFINHGLPSVVGVDMSRAIAVNIPFLSDTEKTFGERVGGVWGGMAKKPIMAGSALQSGDYLRAIESLMPEFVANPMRAARQYGQGATTLAGKPIFDENGQQMRYGVTDVAKKSLGFNPMDVSERTELRGHARGLQAHWNDKRDDALAQIRRAEKGKQILEIMGRFNQDLKKSQAYGMVGLITVESVHRARNAQPNKKQMQWQQSRLQ